MYLLNLSEMLARIAAKACRKNARTVAMREYILNNVSEKKHI